MMKKPSTLNVQKTFSEAKIAIVIAVFLLVYCLSPFITPYAIVKFLALSGTFVTLLVALRQAARYFLPKMKIHKLNSVNMVIIMLVAAVISAASQHGDEIISRFVPAKEYFEIEEDDEVPMAQEIPGYAHLGMRHDFFNDDTAERIAERIAETFRSMEYDYEIAARKENYNAIKMLNDKYVPALNDRYRGKIDDKQRNDAYLWNSKYYDFEFSHDLFGVLCEFTEFFGYERQNEGVLDIESAEALCRMILDIIERHGTFEISKYLMIILVDAADALSRESSEKDTKILGGSHIAHEFLKTSAIIGAKELIRLKKSGSYDESKMKTIGERLRISYVRLGGYEPNRYDSKIAFLKDFIVNPRKFLSA